MVANGKKIRTLREGNGLTQEMLARKANVHIRTVQRAEEGQAIRLETFADLASVLTVDVNDLIEHKTDNSRQTIDGTAVILRPSTSAAEIIGALRDSFDHRVACEVEPTRENVDQLSRLSTIIDRFHGSITCPAAPCTYAELLHLIADANEAISALDQKEISVYFGTCTFMKRLPCYEPLPHGDGLGMKVSDEAFPMICAVIRIAPKGKGQRLVTVKSYWWEE